MTTIFSFNYKSKNGPQNYEQIQLSTLSPQGSCIIKQLDADNQYFEQGQNYPKLSYLTNFKQICSFMGVKIEGEEDVKQKFFNQFQIQSIHDFTILINDDCGKQIFIMASFRTQQKHYSIESTRYWPQYQP